VPALPQDTQKPRRSHLSARPLSHAILAALADSTAVTVDMTATTFIDCTALGGLIRTYKLLKEDGVEQRIAASYHRVRGLLAYFGTDQWIRVFDTLPEAVAATPVTAKPTWSPYRQAA
jgi:anti-anti-sigma factor